MTVDEAVVCLDGARRANRLGQGYIFEGPPGGEGMALTERFLSLLFCESDARRPCGACRACRRVEERTHPDVLWVEPQKKSRQVLVEQVRALQGRMVQTSFGGGWKVGVIVGADRMNLSASNAFLKILEEPPGASLFVLVTDSPQLLLPTIVSRCQKLSVSRDELRLPDAWREQLVAVLAEHDDGQIGGGRIVFVEHGRAQLEVLFKQVRQAATEYESEVAEQEATDEECATQAARIEARYCEFRADVLRGLLRWYRDILVLLCGGDPSLVYFTDELEVLSRRAEALTYAQAMANLRVVEDVNKKLEQNLPEPLVLADALHRLQ